MAAPRKKKTATPARKKDEPRAMSTLPEKMPPARPGFVMTDAHRKLVKLLARVAVEDYLLKVGDNAKKKRRPR